MNIIAESVARIGYGFNSHHLGRLGLWYGNSGRSGWYRLFLYQMQEESLKLDEEKKRLEKVVPVEVFEKVTELTDGSAIVGEEKKTRKVRRKEAKEVKKNKGLHFKPSAIKYPEVTENYLAKIYGIYAELQEMFLSYKKVISQVVFHDDDSEDEEWLLLSF